MFKLSPSNTHKKKIFTTNKYKKKTNDKCTNDEDYPRMDDKLMYGK